MVSVIIPNLDEVMQMIEKNIFRPLPNVKKSNLNFAETGIDQEEEMDPAWPHLQGIYEFFLQLVINESVEVRSLKVYVTPQFVQEFLDLFDSEESVERDYLKNILHKLYAKVSVKDWIVLNCGLTQSNPSKVPSAGSKTWDFRVSFECQRAGFD